MARATSACTCTSRSPTSSCSRTPARSRQTDVAALGKDPERAITDKAGVVTFLRESFEAVRAAYPTADRAKKVQLFKKDVTADDVFVRILVHNHEHMGQAVAYARMNGIVPPWAAGAR